MDLVIKEEEIKEIENEVRQIENKKLENLEIKSKRLNDLIIRSPQQLPIVFLIKKELNQLQASMNFNSQNKSDILTNFHTTQSNLYNSSKDNISKIERRSLEIYSIFNSMYTDYFHTIIINFINNERFQKVPIFQIIADSEHLSDLVDKKSQQNNLTEDGWKKKNTPKYWPLRIKEALTSIFEFKRDAKFDEAIEYFETNCLLFIFISKLNKASKELIDAYKLLFDSESKDKAKLPKQNKMIIDSYIHHKLSDFESPKSCSRFIESITSNINFDIFPSEIPKNSE